MSTQSGQPAPGVAIVTGASSGIGAAYAARLAALGSALVLVARRRDRLEGLASQLRAEFAVAVDVLAADLTVPDELRLVEAVAAERPALDFLVNCAGFGGYMPFVQLPADDAEQLIRLHIITLTRLTRAALPGMLALARGAIVNVSSGLAFSASMTAPPLPHRAVYAAAKSYINTFSETLAGELADSGVRVQALCPGVVRTEFHKVAGQDVSHVPAIMEADDVVTASLASLALGETVCLPALADPATLSGFTASRNRVFEGVRGQTIAPRYAGRD